MLKSGIWKNIRLCYVHHSCYQKFWINILQRCKILLLRWKRGLGTVVTGVTIDPIFSLKWGIMGRKGDRMYQYSIPQCITFTPFPSHSTITWKSTAYAILLFVDCYNCPRFPLFHTFFSAHTGQNIHSTHNKSQQNQSNSKIHSIKRKTKIQKDKNLGLVHKTKIPK